MKPEWARYRKAMSNASTVRSGGGPTGQTQQPSHPRRRGPRKQAKTLTDREFEYFYRKVISESRVPESDALKLLLSQFAGLRAIEIAGLTMDAVTTPDGKISKFIWVGGHIAKGGHGRKIPMHPRIRDALREYRKQRPYNEYLSITAANGRGPVKGSSLAVWFWRKYRDADLVGCSSHSGRRSFITNLAQRANRFHSSLADVQKLAGHMRLETTANYIAPSEDTSAMVDSLGKRPRPQHRPGEAKRASYDW
jgi:integrase